MDCPKDYVENNDMERESANNILSKYIEKMNWKQDEVILDVGCGSGDVTFDIVYVCSKNIIKQLVSYKCCNYFENCFSYNIQFVYRLVFTYQKKW